MSKGHRPTAAAFAVLRSVSELGWEWPVLNWEMKLVSRSQGAKDRRLRFILTVE